MLPMKSYDYRDYRILIMGTGSAFVLGPQIRWSRSQTSAQTPETKHLRRSLLIEVESREAAEAWIDQRRLNAIASVV